jgi:hypothetical protein
MKPLNNSLLSTRRVAMTRLGVRSLALLLFVLAFAVPSAFGQMGSSATYSDMWIDDSAAPSEYYEDAPPPPYYVVSCGVTQDNYNSYRHTYWVGMTLRSPNNRSASGTSYKTSSFNAYTRVDVSMPYDVHDLGDFQFSSSHTMCCPYMAANPDTGVNCVTSFINGTGQLGASIDCYVLQSFDPASQIAVLTRQVPCRDTYCGGSTYTFHYSGSPPQLLETVTPYLRFGTLVVCSPVFAAMRASSCTCGDVETNLCAISPQPPLCN